MKVRNKQESAAVKKATARSVDYEVTIAELALRSQRRAWWVAFSAIFMAIILALGYFLMLPLKEKEPFLVMADAYTGTSSVAKLRWDFDTNSIFSSEAINKSNVSHFVVARESFDRTELSRNRDWVIVNSMSSGDVVKPYREQFNSANPSNIYKKYQPNESVRVNLLSIQLSGPDKLQVGKDATPAQAVVRFQRLLYNKDNATSKLLDTNIATIQFRYRTDLDMSDRLRMENPLGFQVVGYRVDRELNGSSVLPSADNQQVDAAASPAMTQSTAGTPGLPGQDGVQAQPAAGADTTAPNQ